MRQLLPLLFTAIATLVQAQDVQFTDTRFSKYLLNHAQVQGYDNGSYPVIQLDADSNGIISIEEAKRVYRLTCVGNIVGLNYNDKFGGVGGIESFENLEFFDMSEQRTPHVYFDKNVKLKTFVSLNGDLNSATFIGLDSLTVIDIDQNRLYSIILRQLPKLRSVSAYDNLLTELDVSECNSIVDIQLKDNPIQSLCVPTHAYSVVVVDTVISVDTLCGVNIPENNIVFPDSLFKKFLVNHASLSMLVGNQSLPANIDPDGDGEIAYEDAKKVYMMHCAGYSGNVDTLTDLFTDMTGIEEFENLISLQVDNQNIEDIDLSNNKKLQMVALNGNKLKSIRAVGLDSLEVLSAFDNDIVTIEFSDLKKIKHIQLADNKLENLDLSSIESLQSIYCPQNNLSSICVSKFIFDSLDVTKDESAKVDTLCGINEIYIKDQNLLNAILAYQPPIDTNGDSIVTYAEALAVDSINLSFQNILLFTGLDAFKNLKSINISYNQIAFLDVSQLQYLTQLIASNNILKSLITFNNSSVGGRRTSVENNTLRDLDVSNNSFTDLDISIFSELNTFDGSGNTELLEICVTSNQMDNKVGSWSKDVTTTWSASNCARITSVSKDDFANMAIYPNPASSVVWTTQKVSHIYTMLGNKKEIKWISDSSIDISNFDSGVYTFQFSDGTTSRLVVNKR